MRINEVAKKFNVPEATLRYWEQVSIIPPINRNHAGIRDYDHGDEEWIHFVILMRRSGVDIKRLQEYTKLFQSGSDTKADRLRILKSQLKVINEKFEQFKASRELLIWKIKHYDEVDEMFKNKLNQNLIKGADKK